MLAARGRGFFIPHRYAATVRPPPAYGSLVPLFEAAGPGFRGLLAAAAPHLPALRALAGPPPLPRFDQDWFPRLDGVVAHTLVSERRPARIVEVGSGHSTRFMARAIAAGGLKTRLVAVDPEPRASLAQLPVEWIRTTVQNAPAALFDGLAAGDVVFVDSSHILVPGSDVDWILATVLPRLMAGVLVHFHDVFLPDAYPESWSWRGYNEQNALVPLLIGGGWRLLWSSHWAASRMAADIAAAGIADLPLPKGAFETSLWIERV